jgi:hypothetical protein
MHPFPGDRASVVTSVQQTHAVCSGTLHTIANPVNMVFTHRRKSTEHQTVKRSVTIVWTLMMAAIGVIAAGAAWAGPATEVQIPEPGSLALLAIGVGAVAVYRARRGR